MERRPVEEGLGYGGSEVEEGEGCIRGRVK
jgi:hypothetical protein